MTDCILINYKEQSYKVPYLEGARFIPVDRKPAGIGPLSEAINRGFESVTTDYFMVVTNVQVKDDLLINLLASIGQHAIIQPTYDSDHNHLRAGEGIMQVPFTEFTCCLVKTEVFKEMGKLDERMPYVGFDIDYGIRLAQAGYTAAVDFSQRIEHTYNRHMDMRDPYTKQRAMMRARYDSATRQCLYKKHGIPPSTKLTRLFL